MEDYQWYKQKFAKKKVVPRRDINFSQPRYFGFEGILSMMGWFPLVTVLEPIFPTLVRAFYLRATYGISGPIISTIRGVKIRLDLKSICRIFYIALVRLKVYKSKIWPTILCFELREAI